MYSIQEYTLWILITKWNGYETVNGGYSKASYGALQILFSIGKSTPLHRVHNSHQLTGQRGVLRGAWIDHFGAERFGFLLDFLL